MLSLCRRPGLQLVQLKQFTRFVTSTPPDTSSSTGTRRKTRRSPAKRAGSSTANWKVPEGLDTGVKIKNALTKRLEPLRSQPFKVLSWYMCGPTVYDSTHIGHAHCYMKFDIIRKILKNFFNIRLRLVMNFTDVDDKVILRSQQLNIPVDELTKKYEAEFLQSLDSLKIERANSYVRVTEHIPAIAEYIQVLVNKGYAYHSEKGDVNFDSWYFRQHHHSGKLMQNAFKSSDARKPPFGKKHSADFALWKHSKPAELGWDMEWENVGVVRGRPGWHIECSTLAQIAFGDHVDIHTGGKDLLFPHHENEIVQSEAYNGTEQWVDYFMHSGTLMIDGSKMSKSLGNFITVPELLSKYSPDQFRMLCCMTGYNRDCDYSDEEMEKASSTLASFQSFHTAAIAYVEGKSLGNVSSKRILNKVASCELKIVKCLGNNFQVCMAMVELVSLACFVECEVSPVLMEDALKRPGDGRRSGAVMAAHGFISHTLRNLGFEVAFMDGAASHASKVDGNAPTNVILKDAIDEFMAFRTNVRDLSIGRINQLDGLDSVLKAHFGDSKTEKQLRKEYTGITAPFLKASDELRENLAQKGVEIKDRGVESSWGLLQQ